MCSNRSFQSGLSAETLSVFRRIGFPLNFVHGPIGDLPISPWRVAMNLRQIEAFLAVSASEISDYCNFNISSIARLLGN